MNINHSEKPALLEKGHANTTIERYFQSLGQFEVLTAEQEVELAKEVERLETDYWRALLCQPPAFHAFSFVFKNAVSLDAPGYSTLLELARADARRSLGKRRKARWDAAADELAIHLRAADVDRELVREADAAVRRLVAEMEVDTLDEEGSKPSPAAWQTYLQHVTAARNAQLEVKERFVAANLRLVVSIARRYSRGSQMPLIDLIQEGNMGLMRAVERFDHRRGFRFSTYASWWIRHGVSRARADKGKTIRIPVHMLDACRNIAIAHQRMAMRMGRQPTIAELAEETGLSESKVEQVRAQSTAEAISLDRPLGDDDGRSFVDLVVDGETPSPYEAAESSAWREQVPRLLGSLSPMEARILRLRFGLDDHQELTLKIIGDRYNLSRERIRQIQEQALDKLRRRVPDHPLAANQRG